MNEKLKLQKSCLNCYYFQRGENSAPFCEEHVSFMPEPRIPDDPDYGYCSDYAYKCYYCEHDCCPNNPQNIELI